MFFAKQSFFDYSKGQKENESYAKGKIPAAAGKLWFRPDEAKKRRCRSPGTGVPGDYGYIPGGPGLCTSGGSQA